MDEEKQRIYTVVTIAVLVALLLSCVIGALAGGMAGYVTGRRQARAVAERTLEQEMGRLPWLEEEFRQPWKEDVPLPIPDLEEEFGVVPPRGQGALVHEVIEDSPAEQAGLEPGDVIVAIDRTPIDRLHALPDVIGQYEPGDRVTVHVWRAGQEDAVGVKLGRHPEDPDRAYLGIYFEMMMGGPRFELPSD